MKMFRNIASVLGYFAYKNTMLFFYLYLLLLATCAFLSFSDIAQSQLPSNTIRFGIFLTLAVIIMLLFFIGLNNAKSKNYRVAILKATKTLKELNKPGSCVNEEILAKISILSSKTQQAKDPTSLNEFIQKVQKCDQMKENQKEKRELYKNLPDEINKLDTEIYLLESSLLP